MNIINDHFVLPYKKFFQCFCYFVLNMHRIGTYVNVQRQPADALVSFNKLHNPKMMKRILRLEMIKNISRIFILSTFVVNILFQMGCLIGLLIIGDIFKLCDFSENAMVCQMVMISSSFCDSLFFLITLIPWWNKGMFQLQSNEHLYRAYILPLFYFVLWGAKNYIIAIALFGWLFLLSIKEMGDYLLWYEHISIS